MSKTLTLHAQPREVTGKGVAQLRRDGLTPIVVYGPKAEAISLQVDTHALLDVLAKSGTTGLIHVQVAGESSPRPALTRERQLHPTALNPLHVDFLQVDDKHEVRTVVPVRVTGAPPLPVRLNEAMLRVLIEGVEVRSKPKDLPTQLEVDCSEIETMGQVIRVRDLVLAKGVTILTPGDRPVARLTPIRRGAAPTGDTAGVEGVAEVAGVA